MHGETVKFTSLYCSKWTLRKGLLRGISRVYDAVAFVEPGTNYLRRNVRETGVVVHEELGGWYMNVSSDNGIMDRKLDASY
jgi:hypothetical protein